MSDEFDKEAEREKLRDKLEKDEEKRQETQRMSELLLQGATMTNEHCENCGDPLFRDGERTFCPTCGGETGEQAPDQVTEQAEQTQPEQTQQTQPEQTQQTQPEQPESTADTQQSQASEERANGAASTPQPAEASRTDVGQETTVSVDEQPTQMRQPPGSSAATEAANPRAELQRAVTTTARKANDATDPRTAKAWLEASKEAAEALAALEQ